MNKVNTPFIGRTTNIPTTLSEYVKGAQRSFFKSDIFTAPDVSDVTPNMRTAGMLATTIASSGNPKFWWLDENLTTWHPFDLSTNSIVGVSTHGTFTLEANQQTGSGTDHENFWTYTPAEVDSLIWREWAEEYNGVIEGAPKDQTMQFGWNLGAGAGAWVAGKPVLYDAFESGFVSAYGLQTERHLAFADAYGVYTRFLSFLGPWNGGPTLLMLQSDTVQIGNTSTGNPGGSISVDLNGVRSFSPSGLNSFYTDDNQIWMTAGTSPNVSKLLMNTGGEAYLTSNTGSVGTGAQSGTRFSWTTNQSNIYSPSGAQVYHASDTQGAIFSPDTTSELHVQNAGTMTMKVSTAGVNNAQYGIATDESAYWFLGGRFKMRISTGEGLMIYGDPATSGAPLKPSALFSMRGWYWNGSVSAFSDFQTQFEVTDTAGAGRLNYYLNFQRLAHLDSTGTFSAGAFSTDANAPGNWTLGSHLTGPGTTTNSFFKYVSTDVNSDVFYMNHVISDGGGLLTRNDNVISFGWNLGPGGGLVQTGTRRGGIGWSFEDYWEQVPGDTSTAQMEAHMFYVRPDGTQTRPISLLASLNAPYNAALFIDAYNISMASGPDSNSPPSFLIDSEKTILCAPSQRNSITVLDGASEGLSNIIMQAHNSANTHSAQVGVYDNGSFNVQTKAGLGSLGDVSSSQGNFRWDTNTSYVLSPDATSQVTVNNEQVLLIVGSAGILSVQAPYIVHNKPGYFYGRDNLGTTTTAAAYSIFTRNNTAATSDVPVQYSPAINQTSYGWTGSISRAVSFQTQVKPDGAGAGKWSLNYANDESNFTEIAAFNSTGKLSVGGSVDTNTTALDLGTTNAAVVTIGAGGSSLTYINGQLRVFNNSILAGAGVATNVLSTLGTGDIFITQGDPGYKIRFTYSSPIAGNTVASIDAYGALTIGSIVADPWAVVADGYLTNGWVHHTPSFDEFAFYKTPDGIVRLRGVLNGAGASAGTTAYILPAGYRPTGRRVFAAYSNATLGRIDIDTNGSIIVVAFSTGNWISLDGISFRAEQ